MHLSKLIELMYLGSVNFTENCNLIKRNILINKTSPSQTFCYYLISLLTVALTLRAPLLAPIPQAEHCQRVGPHSLSFPLRMLLVTHSTHSQDTMQLNSQIQVLLPSKVENISSEPKRMYPRGFTHQWPSWQLTTFENKQNNCLLGNIIRPTNIRVSLAHCATLSRAILLSGSSLLPWVKSCYVQRLNSLESGHSKFWFPSGI